MFYPRPGGASPLRVPLVPAFTECTAPDSSHIAPLDGPSCSGPSLQSTQLTTGKTGKGQGLVKLTVFCNGGAPGEAPPCATTDGNQADISILASASDVRKQSDGSDYTGNLILRTAIRLTDQSNGPGGGDSGTVEDTRLDAPLGCTATTDTTIGASCSVTTTANTLVPGMVLERKRAVLSALAVQMLDAGPDGSTGPANCSPTCGTGDETPYLDQGLFTP